VVSYSIVADCRLTSSTAQRMWTNGVVSELSEARSAPFRARVGSNREAEPEAEACDELLGLEDWSMG